MKHHTFAPHGDMTARVQGQVLIVTTIGSWNLEMHQQSAQRSAPLIAELEAKGPWGNVVILEDTLVAGLPIFEAGRKAVQNLPPTSRLKAIAWVISPTLEGYGLLVDQYRNMYSDLLPSRVFDDLASALDWIEGQIPAH